MRVNEVVKNVHQLHSIFARSTFLETLHNFVSLLDSPVISFNCIIVVFQPILFTCNWHPMDQFRLRLSISIKYLVKCNYVLSQFVCDNLIWSVGSMFFDPFET